MFKLNNYFFISILLHFTLFGLMTTYLKHSKIIPSMGSTEAMILNSYIHSGTLSQSEKTQTIPEPSPQTKTKAIDNKAITKITSAEKHLSSPVEKSIAAISQGEDTHLISALLHDAIQKEQHYPPAALQMERQGRVTVAFSLMLDGSVTHLRVISSSGTAMLDQAALNAVTKATPFHEVKKHIQKIEEYQIDVVFELT